MLGHFLCEVVSIWHVQCNFFTAIDVINNNKNENFYILNF
jgi:hypothetical protein